VQVEGRFEILNLTFFRHGLFLSSLHRPLCTTLICSDLLCSIYPQFERSPTQLDLLARLSFSTMAHTALEGSGESFILVLENFAPGLSSQINQMLQTFNLDLDWIIPRLMILFSSAALLRWLIPQCEKFLGLFTSSIFIDSDDMLFQSILAFMIRCLGSGQMRVIKARTNDQALWASDGENIISDAGYVNFSKSTLRNPLIFEPYTRRIIFRWEGRWYFFRREVHTSEARFIPRESITLTVLGWSHDPIQRLIQEARRRLYSHSRCETSIRRPAPREEREHGGNPWTITAVRPSRQIDTVILPNSLKSALLEDMNAFWTPLNRSLYSSRGIPYRRGYLFIGPPGTGKTSCAFALAGFFGVDIYALSLNDPDITDSLFLRLMSKLPRYCIFLLENIDGANILERSNQQSVNNSPASLSGVSLAGLLNAIDGVDSPEGRVLIISTNHPERLDKALIRPGRVDLSFNFRLATRDQMKEIFIRMYSNDKEIPASSVHKEPTEEDCDLVELAATFSDELPENTFSTADIQGYVLTKEDPQDAIKDIGRWRDEQIAKMQSLEYSTD
jgi:chaperone BCS1